MKSEVLSWVLLSTLYIQTIILFVLSHVRNDNILHYLSLASLAICTISCIIGFKEN